MSMSKKPFFFKKFVSFPMLIYRHEHNHFFSLIFSVYSYGEKMENIKCFVPKMDLIESQNIWLNLNSLDRLGVPINCFGIHLGYFKVFFDKF